MAKHPYQWCIVELAIGIVDDGEDDSAVGEVEFDLNQLREARPDLGPENLDTDGVVDFDRGSDQRILIIVCCRNC